MENLKLLTRYIAAWSWQILAMIFLVSCMILLSLPRNILTVVFSISLLGLFICCQYMSVKRKREVYEDE